MATSNTRWTDEMNLRLAQLACKHKGYLRTQMKMEAKWETIAGLLKALPEFESVAITRHSAQVQFRRAQEQVLNAVGILPTGDRSNLSGLPEVPTEYQKLMIDMHKEVEKTKDVVKAKKNKKKKLERFLAATEAAGLMRQSSFEDHNKKKRKNDISTENLKAAVTHLGFPQELRLVDIANLEDSSSDDDDDDLKNDYNDGSRDDLLEEWASFNSPPVMTEQIGTNPSSAGGSGNTANVSEVTSTTTRNDSKLPASSSLKGKKDRSAASTTAFEKLVGGILGDTSRDSDPKLVELEMAERQAKINDERRRLDIEEMRVKNEEARLKIESRSIELQANNQQMMMQMMMMLRQQSSAPVSNSESVNNQASSGLNNSLIYYI
jgi:hypothetical protein